MAAPVNLSEIEKVALAARLLRSPVEFCRVVLPHWFPTKMPWVHRGLFALIFQKTEFLLDFGTENWRDDPAASYGPADLEKILTNFITETGDPTVPGEPIFKLVMDAAGKPALTIHAEANIGVIMPRGFSKTTVFNAAVLIMALYQIEDFFLYVSESGPHAERQLGTVKGELAEDEGPAPNEVLHELFGLHKPGRQDSKKWTENYIETLKNISIGALGSGGQIRGFSKGAKRPGIILYDDFQDEDAVKSPTQNKKDSDWFFGTAMPTVRDMPTPGRNFIMGTLLSDDAVLNLVMVSPEFTCVRFGAIDRQGGALWPYKMDLEKIEKKKQAMARVGKLHQFYLEFMSEYKSDTVRLFPESKLIYISRIVPFIGMALAEDPAISEKDTADFCCFALTGIEASGHKHVVDFYGQQGMDPADQIDKFFELGLSPRMLAVPPENRKYGIESVGFQKALVSLVKAEQFKRTRIWGMNAHFHVEPILHGKTGKLPRIKGILQPLIWSGYLTFEQNWPVLHNQLVDFPSGKDDAPDVVAMSIRLLDPFASLNLEGGEEELSADSAPPLRVVLSGKSFRKAP